VLRFVGEAVLAQARVGFQSKPGRGIPPRLLTCNSPKEESRPAPYAFSSPP
jgi:hypothetical protein